MRGEEGRPTSEIDLQFWAPASFSLLMAGLTDGGREVEHQALRHVYADVVSYSVDQLHRLGSGTRIGERRDQVVIDTTTHPSTEARPFSWHHHVVVSPTLDGRVEAGDVAADELAALAERSVWGAYLRRLRELTSAHGVVWARPEIGAPYEIVEPPLNEHLVGVSSAPCAEVPAARRLVMPTDAQRGLAQRQQQDARRAGSFYGRPAGTL